VHVLASTGVNARDATVLLGLAGEAYFVFTFVEHFAVTFGPDFEVGLVGSGSASWSSTGFESGLLAEF
jgi:hypothetical protein